MTQRNDYAILKDTSVKEGYLDGATNTGDDQTPKAVTALQWTDDKQEKNGCDGCVLARLHVDRQLILNAPQDAKKDFMQFPEMDASLLNVK